MADRPHIVIFNPDQWRGDVLGHRGNLAAVTPVLDSLIEQDAISFRNAFCQNPVCIPSRCSFMTGWYPHTRGHRSMFHMLQPDEPMLLKQLKDSGYYVWWGGKNDVVPAQNGYDDYCDVFYQPPDTPERPMRVDLHRYDDWRGEPDSDTFYSFHYGHISNDADEPYVYDHDWGMVEGAIDLINRYDGDQPLCIYLPLVFPHPPYAVESPWFELIDRSRLPSRTLSPDWSSKPAIMRGIYEGQQLQSWTEDRWDELRATYYGMCARVDHQLGMVIDALQANDLYDDTALFFFADHGDWTGDYGLVEKAQNVFDDRLTNVPLVIKPPASVNVQACVTDALVELIDFTATVYDLAGIQPDYDHFGRSLVSLLTGTSDRHRDAVFCQGGRRHSESQAMGSLSENGLYAPRQRLHHSPGPEHGKATMCRTERYKYVQRLYEDDEFYDLVDDPQELVNRIHDDTLTAEIADHRSLLLQFYLETSDVVPRQLDKRK